MVGYHPQAEKHLTELQQSLAGGASGAVTRAITQPLDVLKIRFQLQVEPVRGLRSSSSKYRGLVQATRSVIAEEGLVALWKGHVPAQGLSLVYGAVQFYTFERLTRCLSELGHEVSSPGVHFACGAMAGCAASIASHPLDVVRTRLVAQGEPKFYRGVYHAFWGLVVHEGPLSLYRGLTPSLLLVAPQIGAIFAFYREFSNLWTSAGLQGDAPPLLKGALAGVCAKTLVYPLDLAKKRLQVKGFEHARKGFGQVVFFRGFAHVMWHSISQEGFSSLFKGLWPSLLKAAATTGLHFSVYEHMCSLLL